MYDRKNYSIRIIFENLEMRDDIFIAALRDYIIPFYPMSILYILR